MEPPSDSASPASSTSLLTVQLREQAVSSIETIGSRFFEQSGVLSGGASKVDYAPLHLY